MAPLPVLAAVVAAAFGSPAQSGDNVVVLRAVNVMIPPVLPGVCAVHGVVEEAPAGMTFRPGQRLVIRVPCAGHTPGSLPPPVRGRREPYLDAEVLRLHKRAVAHVDDGGRLIWRRSAEPYGRYGYVAGYRVLDAVFLPLKPSRPG